MKTKLINVVNADLTLSQFKNEKLPTPLAYKLFKASKAFSENVSFYRTKLQALVNDCGKKKEDGTLSTLNGNIELSPDKKDEWNKGYEELKNLEVDIPDDISFTLDELSLIRLSANDFENIQDFIKEA